MVNGYCEVYNDRSYGVLAEIGNLCRRCIDRCLYFGLGIVSLTGQEQG